MTPRELTDITIMYRILVLNIAKISNFINICLNLFLIKWKSTDYYVVRGFLYL